MPSASFFGPASGLATGFTTPDINATFRRFTRMCTFRIKTGMRKTSSRTVMKIEPVVSALDFESFVVELTSERSIDSGVLTGGVVV